MAGSSRSVVRGALLYLALYGNHILGCLKCDVAGRDALRIFHSIVTGDNDADVGAHRRLRQFAAAASSTLMEDIEGTFLDPFAIFQITQEYRKCVDLIEDAGFKGAQLINTIGIHFQRLKAKFTQILSAHSQRVCPNKKGDIQCGIMVQKFTACNNCEEKRLVCVGGPSHLAEWFVKCGCYCTSAEKCYDVKTMESCAPCTNADQYFKSALLCGERSLEIEEDGDLILDCSLSWHVKLQAQYQYVFFKMSDQTTLRITEEPYFTQAGVQVEDSDVYLCQTQLLSRIPVSIITYNVTVVKGPEVRTHRPPPTLPYEAPVIQDTINHKNLDSMVNTYSQIIVYSCGCIFIIFIPAVCIYMSHRRNRPMKHEKQKRDMEDMLLLSS